MKLSKDIKPISYFKAHAAEIIRELNEQHGTMIITQHGEAKAVIQDIGEYERIQEAMALLKWSLKGKRATKKEKPSQPIRCLMKLKIGLQRTLANELCGRIYFRI